MTDIELFEVDAEFWSGTLTALERSQLLEPAIPRIAYIENEYGCNLDADGRYIQQAAFSAAKHTAHCFFALLVAAALRYEQRRYVDSDRQIRTNIR